MLKFGVGIGSDARRLAAGFGVEASGCVDLQHIALRCGVRWVIVIVHYISLVGGKIHAVRCIYLDKMVK